jgi:hypothetical protein
MRLSFMQMTEVLANLFRLKNTHINDNVQMLTRCCNLCRMGFFLIKKTTFEA